MLISRHTRKKLHKAAAAVLQLVKRINVKAAVSVLLCLVIVFGIVPQTENAQVYGLEWKDLDKHSDSSRVVDRTYILEVSSGTRLGGGYADNILYFSVYYTDTKGVQRNTILMPGVDAVSNGYETAMKAGAPTARRNLVQELFEYTTAPLENRKALGSVVTDQILFTTPERVESIDKIQIFGKASATSNVWPCQGMRVYEVDALGGLEMYGWYSDMGYIDFTGKLIAEVIMAPGGGNFNWNTSGGAHVVSPYAKGTPQDVFLVNTSSKEEYESASGKTTHIGLTVDSQRKNPVIIRMDLADKGGAGFESMLSIYSDSQTEPTIAQSHFVEAASLSIRYEDIFGDLRDITLPLIVNALGAAADILGKDTAIAGFAQQGDSIAIPAVLPMFARVDSLSLTIGSSTAAAACGLIDGGTGSAERTQRMTASNTDSISYTCIAFYKDVDVKVALDGAVIRYSYENAAAGQPASYSAASSVDGMSIEAGKSTSISMNDYNSYMVLEPIDRQYRYLVTISTDTVENAGTMDDVSIQLKYLNLKEKESESPVYFIKDYANAFYGAWPANKDDFGYNYGMRQGGTIQFVVPLQDVKEFTGVSFKLDGEDEWQFAGVSIAKVTSYGKRNIDWKELRSSEKDQSGQSKLKSNVIIGRQVVTDGVLFKVGNVYVDEKDNPKPDDPNWKPGTLIQDDDSSTDFNGKGEVVDKKDEIDWDTVLHYMTYEQAMQDLKFTKQRTNYKVSVQVGGSKVNADDDDCGSKNLFYFQLHFENGNSGCMLANQQITGDAFRTGTISEFYIPCAQDYGDLNAIQIIPDDQDGNSDIYDKLKIQSITVEKITDEFICPTWTAASSDPDGLGWVGIDYREQGEVGSYSGAEGRSVSEIATTYQITESSYNAKFLVSIKTGPYGTSAVQDQSGMTVYTNDKTYYGGMTMSYKYFDRDGEAREAKGIDIVKLMSEYMARSASYERSTELVDENYTVEYAVSDPNYSFRAGKTDSFYITVKNISQFISMSLQLKSDLVTKWNVAAVRIYLVNGQGIRFLNANGEYDYKYAEGSKPTLVAEWESDEGLSASLGIYRYKQQTGMQEIKNILLACDPINLNPDAAGWTSVIAREPRSKNDTFNLYLYPQQKSDDVADPASYTLTAAVRFRDAVTLSQMQVSAGSLAKAYDADGNVYCEYATGLTAKNLDSISGVDVETRSMVPITAPITRGILQVVRGGVLIESYKLSGIANADMGDTMYIANYGTPAHREKVYLQLSADTRSQTLEADVKDMAVALHFRSDVPGAQELRSKYVFLSDAGYTSISGGQVFEIDMDLGDLSAITGASLVSIGALDATVDSIMAVEYDTNNTVYHTFSTREPVALSNRVKRVGENGNVQLLTLKIKTAADDGSVTSGTKGPIKVTVGYYDSYGVIRELTYDDIRPYISSGSGFASGGTDTVTLLVPELADLRWVEFDPQRGTSANVATWKLESLTATTGADGRDISRNLDKLIIENDPLRVSVADVLLTGNVRVIGTDGQTESTYTVNSGGSTSVLVQGDGKADIDVTVYGSYEGTKCTVENYDPSTGATARARIGTTYSYTDSYLNETLASAQDSAANGLSDAEKTAAARVVDVISQMLGSAGTFSEYYNNFIFKAPRNYGDRDLYYRLTVSSAELPEVKFTVDVTVHTESDLLPDALSTWKAEQASAKQAAQAGAAEVDSKIAAIGTPVTLASEAAVTAARSAYDALPAGWNAFVTKYADLEAAEKTISDIKAANAVIGKINAIGTVDLESEALITAARSAYNALTADQQALVDNLSVLEAAEAQLAYLKAPGQVMEKISAIGTVTLESADQITAARSAYDALTAEQKAQVTNLSVLEAAETELAALQAAASGGGSGSGSGG